MFIDCSLFKSEPCITVETSCGCTTELLDNYVELLIRTELNDVGLFTLTIHKDNVTPDLLTCCCAFRVYIDWEEAGIENFRLLDGRITEQTLVDSNSDIYSYSGEGLLSKLGDASINYQRESAGAVKCCEDNDVIHDGIVAVEAEGGYAMFEHVVFVGHIADFEEPPTYTERTASTLVVDDPCDCGLFSIEIDNQDNVEVTEASGTLTITPTIAGAFSFDYRILCDLVVVDTVTITDTADQLVSPTARDVDVVSSLDAFTIDVSTNDNPCDIATVTGFNLGAITNATVVDNGDLTFTITPTAAGAYVVEYTLICDGVDYGIIKDFTGTAVVPIISEVVDVSGTCGDVTDLTLLGSNNATVVDNGDLTVTITPLAVGEFEFDYTTACDGFDYGIVQTFTGLATLPLTAEIIDLSGSCSAPPTQYLLTNSDNAEVCNNGGGSFTVTPLEEGAFSLEYAIFCGFLDSGERGALVGTASLDCDTEYVISDVVGADISGIDVIDGRSFVNIIPTAETYSFSYETFRCGLSDGTTTTVEGTIDKCYTALEAAYEFAVENLETPLDDRNTEIVNCFTVTAPETDVTENYCGTGSGKTLLEQLTNMAKNHSFDFSVTTIDDVDDCCIQYTVDFNTIGTDLRPFTLSECLGTVEIQSIEDDCDDIKSVTMLGDGIQETFTTDYVGDCGRELVVSAYDLDNTTLSLTARRNILQTRAQEVAVEEQTVLEVVFTTIWNCILIPFKGDSRDFTYLWLGDKLNFESDVLGTRSYRVTKMFLQIQNGVLLNVLPAMEQIDT